MTPEQQTALEGVVGRQLVAADIAAIEAHLEVRNDVAIAAALSLGRVKHGPTQIGPGTVIAVLGDPRGGLFLDAVEELGKTDRTVYWGMDPVRRGALDLQVPAARAALVVLKPKLPDFADDIDKILAVGVVPDPIPFGAVSDALNKAEGRMTL
jgi:hypothetical protein